jgi:hypothetical protein
MAFLAALPIVGKVLNGIFGLIDQKIEDKDKANELKTQLNNVLLTADLSKFSEQIQAQTDIIVAEAKGGSWLQRNWRPGLMALFGIIIANNYIMYPYLRLFWPEAPVLELPPDMWALLKIGVGGYVVGRTAEKGIATWKGDM